MLIIEKIPINKAFLWEEESFQGLVFIYFITKWIILLRIKHFDENC